MSKIDAIWVGRGVGGVSEDENLVSISDSREEQPT